MFQQVFSTLNNRTSNPNQRHLPMINSITTSASSFMYEVNQMRRKKRLMAWFRNTPELAAFVTKIARDITSKYHFEPMKKTESGRNKILKANKFALQVRASETMFQQAVDMIVTGEGYGWIGKLDQSQIKENLRKAYSKVVPVELKGYENVYVEKLFKDLKKKEKKAITDLEPITGAVDEELLIPRKYRYVPATTVENRHDEYDFINYSHVVGARQVTFQPDELIRYTLMNADGKPSGYSCVDSILVQLELLRFMWLNMLSIERNGGMPDKIIIAKDTDPSNASFRHMEEMLYKYKLVENKHGNMLFTGDISIEDIRSIEDMQFKDLGLYITGLLAMQWGITKEDIPFIVGGTNNKADVGGGAADSYFDVIEYFQDRFAQDMNTQLWIPFFGVKLVFETPNTQRSIRMETARMNKLSNLSTENTIWQSVGKQLNDATLMNELGRDESDLQEFEFDPVQQQQQEQMDKAAASSIGTQQQPKKDSKPQNDQNRADQKRQEQAQTAANRGSQNTGVGKEWDSKADMEYKQLIGQDTMDIDITTFVRLYNEDKAYQSGKPPRIFQRVNDMFTSYIFKSSDFVYKTIIPNEDMEEQWVKLMNLGNNVYRL